MIPEESGGQEEVRPIKRGREKQQTPYSTPKKVKTTGPIDLSRDKVSAPVTESIGMFF